MIDTHGKPKRIRTDNGPEFTSKRLQTWLDEKKIKWNPIQNGKPQQNAIVERFNRTFREDILDSQIFDSIENAQAISQEWLEDYNSVRPHQALKNLTPLEYAMWKGFLKAFIFQSVGKTKALHLAELLSTLRSDEPIPGRLLLSRARFRFSSTHQISKPNSIFTTCRKKQPRSCVRNS